MTPRLKCVLLVDDDEATNFLNQQILSDIGCAERVVTLEDGRQALDFLQTRDAGAYPRPELIFLDINMPGMDGWEFLEAYRTLDLAVRGGIVIVLLTTSLNPADRLRAEQSGMVGFSNKPLTVSSLVEILRNAFPDRT